LAGSGRLLRSKVCAVASFEGLAITGLASRDGLMVRAAYLAMERTAWFVIVPLAFTSLLTGLIMALGTKWGLFRHYWVLAKFLINALAIIILLLHVRLIGTVASAAAERTLFSADLRAVRIQLVAIASAALLALLVATALAVFKPRGMTPYGRRKQQHDRRETLRGTPATRKSLEGMRPETANGGAGVRWRISGFQIGRWH
jgi:hypothetical protein